MNPTLKWKNAAFIDWYVDFTRRFRQSTVIHFTEEDRLYPYGIMYKIIDGLKENDQAGKLPGGVFFNGIGS